MRSRCILPAQHLPRGEPDLLGVLRGRHLLATLRLDLADLDPAALRADAESVLVDANDLAGLALHVGEAAGRVQAGIEDLKLLAVEGRPGAGRGIRRTDQVVDLLGMSAPAD